MDSPSDEAGLEPGSSPATYVPEPFEGLPAIFGAEDPAARGWRARHRPTRTPRRRKPAAKELTAKHAAVVATSNPDEPEPQDPAPPAPSYVPAPEPPAEPPQRPAPPPAQTPLPPTPPPPTPAPPPPPPVRAAAPAPLPPTPLAPTPTPAAPPPAPVRVPAPPAPPTPPPTPSVRVSRPEPPPVRVPEPQSPRWWPALPPPDAPVAEAPSHAPEPNYQPEPYDPRTAGAVLPAADILQLYGTVLRKRRRGSGMLTLLVLVAILLGTSYYAWRQIQKNNHHAPTSTSYTSVAGHFTARFPSAPQEQTAIQRHGKLRMRVQTVADAADHVAVGSVRISAPIPKGQTTAVLVGLGKGLGSDGALTLARQQRTSFRAHPAVEGELWAVDGSPFTFLGVVYNERQLYVLLAPSGSSYTQLKASFLPLG